MANPYHPPHAIRLPAATQFLSKLIAWILVPLSPFLAMAVIVYIDQLSNDWCLGVWAIVSIAILVLWRRWTFRLERSYGTLRNQKVDESTQQSLVTWVWRITFASILICTSTLLCLAFFPITNTRLKIILMFGVVVWSSIAKGGYLSLTFNSILGEHFRGHELNFTPHEAEPRDATESSN